MTSCRPIRETYIVGNLNEVAMAYLMVNLEFDKDFKNNQQ
jgi:hypothetical protein